MLVSMPSRLTKGWLGATFRHGKNSIDMLINLTNKKNIIGGSLQP
jgi:hypothetical protein